MSHAPSSRAKRTARALALIAAALIPLAIVASPRLPADSPARPAGEELYRRGVLPSGVPLRATVLGDVPIEGTSAACTTCHQRSGMGSVEGRLWVPPVAGRVLFATRGSGQRLRPAYDDVALARALRDGVDVAGRPLDPLMPRYDLGSAELGALTAYLHGLGSEAAPGVTASEIRFATIVTPDADPAGRRAMSDVLETFFRNKAVQVRAIAKFGTYHDTFRRWVLSTWELSGPSSTWRAQLEERYAKEPVFAIVSGIGGTEWTPVHDFCETRRIPCLLPNVDVAPASAGKSYYSLYVSRGVALEAAAVAAEIASDPAPARVIQVVPTCGPGLAGADALRTALAVRKNVEIVNKIVVPGVLARKTLAAHKDGLRRAMNARPGSGRSRKPMPTRRARKHHRFPAGRRPDRRQGVALVPLTKNDSLCRRPAAAGASVSVRPRRIVVFWTPPTLARSALEGEEGEDPWDRAFVSSTVLDGEPAAIAASALPRSELVHPFTRPDELGRRLANLEIWLHARGVPAGLRRIQDQTLLACTLTGDALMHEFRDFDRDYFLELVDHVGSNQTVSAFHSRLSFGPGQRLLEKGCWLVPAEGDARAARWVTP
jgi:hypothetical protein